MFQMDLRGHLGYENSKKSAEKSKQVNRKEAEMTTARSTSADDNEKFEKYHDLIFVYY